MGGHAREPVLLSPNDRIVKPQQRIGHVIERPIVADRVRHARDQFRRDEGVHNRHQGRGGRLHVIANRAPGVIAEGDGGQGRMIQVQLPRLGRHGVFAQQEGDFAEQGGGWRQHPLTDPPVEVRSAGREIVVAHFSSVRRDAPDNGVRLHRRREVGEVVERAGDAKVERRDAKVEPRPTAKRGGAG